MMKATFTDKIVELSNNKELEHCVGEWYLTGIIEDISKTCLCGKVNNTLYSFTNKENNNEIFADFVCIGKFMKEKKDDAVILCKQYNYQSKTPKNPKRMCHGCHKHNINGEEESWRVICRTCWGCGVRDPVPIPILGHKICNTCFTLNVPPTSKNDTCSTCYKKVSNNEINEDLLRECSICGLKKLLKTDPAFKDKCTDCFKQAKVKEETEEKRACVVCEKLLIPISKPDYVDKCTDCFKETTKEKNNEKRACSICKELKIPVTAPTFKDKCTDCYKIESTKLRECSLCFKVTIPGNKPSYINKCDDCYKISKENKATNKTVGTNDAMRQCISCKQYVIPSYSPDFKQKCNDCLTIKQDIPTGIPDIKSHKGNLDMLNIIMRKK